MGALSNYMGRYLTSVHRHSKGALMDQRRIKDVSGEEAVLSAVGRQDNHSALPDASNSYASTNSEQVDFQPLPQLSNFT